MYRDDPLDDEQELRDIVGDDPVDVLLADDVLVEALDVLRLLQGWVSDELAGRWFTEPQQRLDGDTPIEALTQGDVDDVHDAARRWVAAQG